jgi:uncharacterized membrane protein YhaH (DUF805 family)
MKWMIMPFARYAEFSGRSRRREYWMFTLFNFIAIAALLIAGTAVGSVVSDDTEAMFILPAVLCVLYGLAVIVPGIAVQVRRLHDQDRSGWLILINLIPYLGGLIMLILMLLSGTPGANQYGPDPKQDEAV